MARKRTWKAHALDFIKEHDKCPGDVPPTGGMDDLLTEQEFIAMARASGLHTWDSCHYVDEILGLDPTDKLKKIPLTQDRNELLQTVKTLREPMAEVARSKKLAEFKAKMKNYVDRINFKDDQLNVPSVLLKFAEYADKFFNG